MRAPESSIATPQTTTTSLSDLASFVGTLGGIVVLIGALLAFDLFVARVDLRESARHAESEYQRGLALLSDNQPLPAADRFEAALLIARTNVNYALALGEAQFRAGKSSEAEATLKTLLERAENDGAVNLAMARVLAGEGRVAEAKSFFHRAIYGRWAADSVVRRTEARYALIDLLAAHGGGRDLLAELLPLEDVPADSFALRKRLGRWFLLAGSPVRAANMFREVLHHDETDPDAFAGMGEAALAQGNFRTARADFAQAAVFAPNDDQLAARIAFADTLLSEDPLARGLDAAERVARGRALVGRMLSVLAPCLSGTSRWAEPARAIAADSARGADFATADSVTTIAEQLWTTVAPQCQASGSDPTVSLLAARLTQ